MTQLAVECRGVGKTYKDFTLDKIDLQLEQGQIMGFIGSNGAGKSTTIRILMGLVHQDEGLVRVLGQEMPENQAIAKEQIGYVSEDMRLYPAATLEWHMAFMASIYPGWDQKYADKLATKFDLKTDQTTRKMSHGQRVKSALLLALARFPKLLILDEPTTGLDPVARQEVLAAMMEVLIDEERTILFSSHNTQDIEQLSDCITFIDRGQIIASSDKEMFLERWRRIRIELPENQSFPQIDHIKHMQTSGRLAVLTTDNFSDVMASKVEAVGATIQGVEHLTLEEIFVADVSASRGRAL